MKSFKPLVILALIALLGRMSLLEVRQAPASGDDGATTTEMAIAMPPGLASCGGTAINFEAVIDAEGSNISPVRFGTSDSLTWFHTVGGLRFGPGVATMGEVITWDGYLGRSGTSQPNEQVRIEFFLGGNHVASTPFTTDVPDGGESQFAITNLGSVNLPGGADEVRIVHHDWSESSTTENSMIVSGICFGHTPAEQQPAAPADPSAEKPESDEQPAAEEPASEPEAPAEPSEEPVAPAEEEPSAPPDEPAKEPVVDPIVPDEPLVCDDNPDTPEPEGGCTPDPAPPVANPDAGDGDSEDQEPQPELAITGSSTEIAASIGIILLLLGISFDGSLARLFGRREI
ncbi:MAG: hypothetical protein V3V01_12235 [Acidimicrobiales bacterium]